MDLGQEARKDGLRLLEATFLHTPGIGATTEKRLWAAGITSWERALSEDIAAVVGKSKSAPLLDTVTASRAALQRSDYAYFARALPNIHHWRAVPNFDRKIGFLDIETSMWNQVTVVGLYDGLRMRTFIRGDNLDELASAMDKYALLVTFNGASFDLPVLTRQCGIRFDQLHVDLCHLFRRLGYKGGLKQVERDLGITRESDILGMSGSDAVLLWEAYTRGSAQALQQLVAYNTADVMNMELLLEIAIGKSAALLGHPP